MPILILVIAIILVIAGINDQLSLLGKLVKDDIEPADGSVSFGVWILAIGIAGSLGYVKELKPISNGFLILIFLGIILSAQKGTSSGFFTNLQMAFKDLGKGLPAPPKSSSSSGSSVGDTIGNIISMVAGSGSNSSNTVTSTYDGITSYN